MPTDSDQATAPPALRLRRLTFLDDGGEVTVGCAETGSYAVLPADGAALLQRLAAGSSADQASAWYLECYGESVDMDDFIEALAELEFLRGDSDDSESPGTTGPVRWQRLGRAVFSPIGLLAMAALVIGWVAELARHPDLVLSNHDLFFTKYMTVLEVVAFLGQFPLLAFHESFHALAGRRLGLRSKLSVGRRLYYVVFLTELDGLVTVPRGKRYLPMLAGMLADVLVIAALSSVAEATRRPDGAFSTTGTVCLALAYTTVLRVIWQFYFYLETDLYYTVVTVLGCVNLQATARAIQRNRWNRMRRRTDELIDPDTWHPRDRAVGRWYSWLMLAGWTFSLTVGPLIMLPVTYRVMSTVLRRLIHPAGQSGAVLADSVVFLTLNLLQILGIWWMVRRDRRRAKAVPELHHVLS
jgi:hypothetical protein